MSRLANKVALVTGANQGMGRAITQKFVAQGAIVYALDIKEESDYGEDITFIKCDVSKQEDWQNAIKQVLDEQSSIDILVNNAGIIDYSPIHEITLDTWNKVTGVNQTGVLLGMKAVIPQMRKQQKGSIINTSSIWGIVGAENTVAYNATKGAVTLMTKNAAITYAKEGIRVNSLHPGFVNTPLTEKQAEDTNEVVINATPMGRGAEPEELANAVLFLASDESSYVTGAEIVVDGGFTAQ
ncbi:MAG: SDR family NAD(P)-dependent oxidoreductase [Thermonemataceae bacterium]